MGAANRSAFPMTHRRASEHDRCLSRRAAGAFRWAMATTPDAHTVMATCSHSRHLAIARSATALALKVDSRITEANSKPNSVVGVSLRKVCCLAVLLHSETSAPSTPYLGPFRL